MSKSRDAQKSPLEQEGFSPMSVDGILATDSKEI